MSSHNSNNPSPRGIEINRRPIRKNHGTRKKTKKESLWSKLDLFAIAVFIMGIVSCYTTTIGLQPMLDNWILSFAMAFALSVFMVAIALRIPHAFADGSHKRLIAGYSFVAFFSVLLNFNAIYGVFTAEKLLYEELKNNKSSLTSIQVASREALDKHFGTFELERKLKEAEGLLAEETTNTMDPGYGTKARKLNKETVIPLKAQLSAAKAKYDPLVIKIDSMVIDAQATIDAALASGKIKDYRVAVDKSIDTYGFVGESTQNQVGNEGFAFEGLEFKHRDVGNLNHSLWTLFSLGSLNGKQASAVVVSLLLAILIDFIVLFVLVMIHKPGAGAPIPAAQSSMAQAGTVTPAAFNPFAQNIQHEEEEEEEEDESYSLERESIYAFRKGNDRKTKVEDEPSNYNPPRPRPEVEVPDFLKSPKWDARSQKFSSEPVIQQTVVKTTEEEKPVWIKAKENLEQEAQKEEELIEEVEAPRLEAVASEEPVFPLTNELDSEEEEDTFEDVLEKYPVEESLEEVLPEEDEAVEEDLVEEELIEEGEEEDASLELSEESVEEEEEEEEESIDISALLKKYPPKHKK